MGHLLSSDSRQESRSRAYPLTRLTSRESNRETRVGIRRYTDVEGVRAVALVERCFVSPPYAEQAWYHAVHDVDTHPRATVQSSSNGVSSLSTGVTYSAVTRSSTVTRDNRLVRPHSTAGVTEQNVLGTELEPCSEDPMTGYERDGCCGSHPADVSRHEVCAVMTEAFLTFSRNNGNDLITPRPKLQFPGLEPGDSWCLCVGRWAEAVEAGVAPPVVLEATNEAVLDELDMETLTDNEYDPAEHDLA